MASCIAKIDAAQGTNLAACIESKQVAALEALSLEWLSDTLSAEGLHDCCFTVLLEMMPTSVTSAGPEQCLTGDAQMADMANYRSVCVTLSQMQ